MRRSSTSRTSRAIRPAAATTTLTLAADVSGGVGCDLEAPDDPDPPPPVDLPEDLNAIFRLGDATTVPGGRGSIPFFVEADGNIQGLTFGIDFDDTVLLGTEVEKFYTVAWDSVNEHTRGFESIDIINDREDFEWGDGEESGAVVGAVIFDFHSNAYELPANQENHLLTIHFDVKQGVSPGTSTEVSFHDGIVGRGQPIKNLLTAFNTAWSPESSNSWVFVNGFLKVIDEIAVFRRGDSNGDQSVDISDAQNSLGFLFSSSGRVLCLDAADANDDGFVNMSDPVATLNFLFSQGPPLPPPTEVAGTDPTPDDLSCRLGVK